MAERAAVEERRRLPDDLWERIGAVLPPERPHPKGGRPWMPARRAMGAIFYGLRTGCPWKALPRSPGAGSTAHDRFVAWCQAGVFRQLWQRGSLEFDARVGLDWEWQAMDGAMTKAPLGGGKNRGQPDRSSPAGHEALAAHRGAWGAHWPRRRRRQSPRHEAGRGDAAGDRHPPAGAHARTAAERVSG